MSAQRKFFRLVRCIWREMKRRSALVTVMGIVLLWMLLMPGQKSSSHASYCEPIDVVYTWVNGSDPSFIDAVRRFHPSYDPARFDDKNELRYSLRSLEKYAPWIRHVYIITNGQIPYWLDLSYEKLTVVPHEVISPRPQLLPTFSSSAIETFIHRIPKLSRRFLYMNDDIFLGATLYPEDLYTESEGVRIYQAWMVPDCAEDCSWTYIGDGACDKHCNIAECQYDGGDCSAIEDDKSEEEVQSEPEVVETKPQHTKQATKKNETSRVEIRRFPLRKKFRYRQIDSRNVTRFRELVRHRNLTTLSELRSIVDSYNSQLKSKSHNPPMELQTSSKTFVPPTPHRTSERKSTKDIFSHSLIHTNMLLNRHYGFRARNVLAHVGFLLDRDIINEMHKKFADEIAATAVKRFRSSDDFQFAFGYYSFLMSETYSATVGEIFDEFDTDSSLTWSDREVRTFLTRMYPLPLDWSAVRFFEEVIRNCSRDLGSDERAESIKYTTLVYERYADSTLPTISRELVLKCALLSEALEANFATRSKYKFNINSKRFVHSNFMMLTSNVTDVVDALDKIRRNPRKFNCINDNLEPQYAEDNELIRHLLEDFYLSFFPRRSRFELQFEYRNRFDNWHDYQRWRRRKRAALVVGYTASALLIIFLVRFLCAHKAKLVRRCVQKL